MPYYLPFGKAGGLQIRCCRGIAVADYGFTLGALALNPSSFCNVRGEPRAWMADRAAKWTVPTLVSMIRTAYSRDSAVVRSLFFLQVAPGLHL